MGKQCVQSSVNRVEIIRANWTGEQGVNQEVSLEVIAIGHIRDWDTNLGRWLGKRKIRKRYEKSNKENSSELDY